MEKEQVKVHMYKISNYIYIKKFKRSKYTSVLN